MAEIILTFEWDGKTIHKETKGFTGKQCVDKSKYLEDSLGGAGERKYKVEYYARQQEESRARTRN